MTACAQREKEKGIVIRTNDYSKVNLSYMKRALCLMKSSMAERLPNAWLVAMKKNTPILVKQKKTMYQNPRL